MVSDDLITMTERMLAAANETDRQVEAYLVASAARDAEAKRHIRHLLTLCRDCGGSGLVRGGYSEESVCACGQRLARGADQCLECWRTNRKDTRTAAIRRTPDAEQPCPSCREARAFLGVV